MPRIPLTITLFLSSYVPMFVLVGIRSWDQSCAVAWASLGLAVLGVAGLALFLRSSQKLADHPVRVVQIEKRDEDIAAYAATYLLPFVTVFDGSARDVLSLIGFIAVLGVVYVRSRLIYINPLLSLLGYDLYRVMAIGPDADSSQGDVGWPRYLLCRRVTIERRDVIYVREPIPDLYLYAGHRTPNEQPAVFDPDT